MKRLMIATLILMGFGVAGFAQTAPVIKKDESKMHVTKKSTEKKADGKVVEMKKTEKKISGSEAAVNANAPKKVETTTSSSTTVLKKDGTPDKRYAANKHLKADGTKDMRYKENKKTK